MASNLAFYLEQDGVQPDKLVNLEARVGIVVQSGGGATDFRTLPLRGIITKKKLFFPYIRHPLSHARE